MTFQKTIIEKDEVRKNIRKLNKARKEDFKV